MSELPEKMAKTIRQMPDFELPDDLREPLHSLQADVKYLIGRVQSDSSIGDMIADSILSRLSQIEEASYRLLAKALSAQIASSSNERAQS